MRLAKNVKLRRNSASKSKTNDLKKEATNSLPEWSKVGIPPFVLIIFI